MTAEVGVLNRIGVALAADSAVTLGSGKIYASAEKLFQLSESAPVGAMVFGHASLLGIPWETVVKTYRSAIRTKSYDTVEEYLDSFCGFLEGHRAMFSESAQTYDIKGRALSYFEHIRNERLLDKLGLRSFPPKKLPRPVEVKRALHEIAEGLLDELEKYVALYFDRKTILREYGGVIDDARDEVLGPFGMYKKTQRTLRKVVCEMLRRRYPTPFLSGVVIAGFGQEEYFPALHAVRLDGFQTNKLRSLEKDKAVVTGSSQAFIVPFAQGEMVATFMNGINPDLQDTVETSTVQVLRGTVKKLLGEVQKEEPDLADRLETAFVPVIEEQLKALLGAWGTEQREKHSEPVMRVVAALPKDELAAMAESLINLTKFKRRVSEQQETVGGPIDVAVITKGDGFVWIQRKHYFSSEHNPRAIARIWRTVLP